MAVRFLESATGRRLAYALHGKGPPLVCTAWWVSHLERDWEDPSFRTFFSRLAKHHTLVRYDRAGVGLSDWGRTRFDLESEYEDLASLVEHLDLERTALLGISCGGPPAILYAARHPERVSRLALYGSFACGQDLGDGEVRRALAALVRASWGLGANTLLDLFDPDLPPEDARRMLRAQVESADPEMAARLLELTFRMDAREEAARVRAPTLVLHRRDERTSRFEAGRSLAAHLRGAELVSLEGHAHVPWRGDAGSVLDRLLAFLGAEEEAQTGDLGTVRATNELVREGDVWRVTFEGRRAYVKHRKGLADLAVLLASPGVAVHALDLMEGTLDAPRPRPVAAARLDARAEEAYRARLAELERETARAEDAADLGHLERLQAEREALLAELASAVGLGGRRRPLGDPAERARKAVSARIREGIARVGEVHAALGEHLAASVETGLLCRYAPEREVLWATG